MTWPATADHRPGKRVYVDLLREASDRGVTVREALVYLGLMQQAPEVGAVLYNAAYAPLVRLWAIWLLEDRPDPPPRRQIAALYYRLGLVTGRAEPWNVVAARLGVGRQWAATLAAKGLAWCWVHLAHHQGPTSHLLPAATERLADLRMLRAGPPDDSWLPEPSQPVARKEEEPQLYDPDYAARCRPIEGYPPWRHEVE